MGNYAPRMTLETGGGQGIFKGRSVVRIAYCVLRGGQRLYVFSDTYQKKYVIPEYTVLPEYSWSESFE
jgi:hypothetical protein